MALAQMALPAGTITSWQIGAGAIEFAFALLRAWAANSAIGAGSAMSLSLIAVLRPQLYRGATVAEILANALSTPLRYKQQHPRLQVDFSTIPSTLTRRLRIRRGPLSFLLHQHALLAPQHRCTSMR